uniref:Armadillo repeat-containing domain-containing protein n=1 Tax=Neogobius melanostomus TaxID=47308 RepID=A0A8C6TLW9_9GOBI
MAESSISTRFVNMKALVGILAGAGASYGLYKLVSLSLRKSATGALSESSEMSLQRDTPMMDYDHPHNLYAVYLYLAGDLEPQHLKMLLSCLQTSNDQEERCRILLTLGNASAFTVNQNLIREYEGIPTIAGFISDAAPEVRVQTLNTLNNLCMNIQNQEQLKFRSMLDLL